MSTNTKNRLQITFLGAAQTVTGSMHLLEIDGHRALIDCGLYQGRRNQSRQLNRNLPRVATEADVALLTHAHIDHSGNLPSLIKHGFKGKIHSTAATEDLCHSMLLDSAHIQSSDARWLNKRNRHVEGWEPVEPLYDDEDATKTLDRFIPHAYDEAFELFEGVTARFIDAGHVLGSASVIIDVDREGLKRRIAFSGDIGRRNLPILRDPTPAEGADYVVMESTYGNRTHEPVERMDEQLAEVVERTRERGGRMVIPSFALERTQEIVFAFNRLIKSGRIKPLPIFVDSPLAMNLTRVFRRHPECYDAEANSFSENHGDPFGFERLRMVQSVEESKRLNDLTEPAIIISASGMCEAGRILHHLRNNIENPNNTVVIVGYQAAHTLGRRLVERRRQVKIFGVKRDLHAEVAVLNAFSAHADKDELQWWAEACGEQVKGIFLVHGDLEPAKELGAALEAKGRTVTIPEPHQTIVLD
ncbi:MAG: MBL fold metallo-hydrolase [Deltaproteobacteria bacterium]|nr:MBL fold metallo-hydrolase [Deltaproteobacteria bacterium]